MVVLCCVDVSMVAVVDSSLLKSAKKPFSQPSETWFGVLRHAEIKFFLGHVEFLTENGVFDDYTNVLFLLIFVSCINIYPTKSNNICICR